MGLPEYVSAVRDVIQAGDESGGVEGPAVVRQLRRVFDDDVDPVPRVDVDPDTLVSPFAVGPGETIRPSADVEQLPLDEG